MTLYPLTLKVTLPVGNYSNASLSCEFRELAKQIVQVIESWPASD